MPGHLRSRSRIYLDHSQVAGTSLEGVINPINDIKEHVSAALVHPENKRDGNKSCTPLVGEHIIFGLLGKGGEQDFCKRFTRRKKKAKINLSKSFHIHTNSTIENGRRDLQQTSIVLQIRCYCMSLVATYRVVLNGI